jgi:hypothetical protein
MEGFLCLGMFAFMAVCFCFGRYILAAITCLTGDKESLHYFGNFCEDKIPYRDTIYTPEEKGEPPDPRVFKWRELNEGPDGKPWKKTGDREGDAA